MSNDFSGNTQVKSRLGFTLIELVVVIAIMAALVGILSPMFVKYIEKSRQATDVTNAEAAYAAAMVYFTSNEGHVPARLYYDGDDVRESETGITGYGKSKHEFTEFVPGDFPISNVGGTPYAGTPNHVIITMGPDGVEGLGWGVVMTAIHADGTPKYTNRIFTPEEYNAASSDDKVARDVELFNSLEAAAKEMTYGELMEMAREQGLYESTYDGKVIIKLASSNIYKTSHEAGDKGSAVNEIFAKELFRKAGFDTNLPKDQTYIVTSRVGEQMDVWIDLGVSEDELLHDADLMSTKAAKVIVYGETSGESEGEKLDDGVLDHATRMQRRLDSI